jgi:hypothetical protein
MLSRIANRIIGNGLKILNFTIGFREIVFVWRFLVWIYFVVSSEQIMAANNLFEEENTPTYGQKLQLILLLVPIAVLWTGCYRNYPKFAEYIDCTKHRLVPRVIGVILCVAYAAVVYTLNPIAFLQQTVWSVAIICCILPVYVRSRCSKQFNELFGNGESSGSSYWEVWTEHLQLRVPPESTEFDDTEHQENEYELNTSGVPEVVCTCRARKDTQVQSL